MLRARTMAGAGGRASASASSESYTGRGSSTPCVGRRTEHTPRYTLGLLQTPHSSESTGGASSAGTRPGGSSGEGLAARRAAGNSAVKPSVSERAGTLSAWVFICFFLLSLLGSGSKELLKAVITEMGQLQLSFIATFCHLAGQNNRNSSLK